MFRDDSLRMSVHFNVRTSVYVEEYKTSSSRGILLPVLRLHRNPLIFRARVRWRAGLFLLAVSVPARGERIVSHGRTDGGHVLFADIQQLRQEEMRAAVAQLPGAVPA